MWEGGRHALPPAKAPIQSLGGGEAEGNITLNTTLLHSPLHTPSPGIDWGAVLIALTVVTVVLAAAVITYLYSRGFKPPRGAPPPPRFATSSEEPDYTYFYEGLRRELRRIYEALLSRLKSLGVMLRPGYTPREVAEAAADTSLAAAAGWIAPVYEEYMYSPKHPSRRIVEEARRRVMGNEG